MTKKNRVVIISIMNTSENLVIRTIIDTIADPSYNMITMHSHTPMEIIYCADGEINLEYLNDNEESRKKIISSGQFLLIKPYTPHRMSIREQAHMYVLELEHKTTSTDVITHVTRYWFGAISSIVNFYAQLSNVKQFIDSSTIETILKEIIELCYKHRNKQTDEFYSIEMNSLIQKLFIEIFRCHLEKQRYNGNKHVKAAMEIIQEHYYDPNLTLDSIAEQLGISSRYLQKIFKERYNSTVVAKLIDFRILKAKELIVNTNNSFAWISKKVGYKNFRSFLAAFSSRTGISPSEYKAKRNAQNSIVSR